jgi:glycine amidinotransferase
MIAGNLTTRKAASSQVNREFEFVSSCPVNSHNGWDPLEEVIVGHLDAAVIPPAHPSVTFNIPKMGARLLRFVAGRRYPKPLVRRAQKQLEGLINLLEAEGVTVRRPDVVDWSRVYRTPDWSSKGFCVACPRDGFIVIGQEIIETPTVLCSRNTSREERAGQPLQSRS